MFKEGDKSVYPNQGVGIIDLIEEKEFHGELKKFCNIHLLHNSLKLMLPFNKLENSNIRLVSDVNTLETVLSNIKKYNIDDEFLSKSKCKDRYEINLAKIKSGTLKDYVDVFSNLYYARKQHSLNSSENQMYNTTKKLLSEEISLIKNITKDEASDLLTHLLA